MLMYLCIHSAFSQSLFLALRQLRRFQQFDSTLGAHLKEVSARFSSPQQGSAQDTHVLVYTLRSFAHFCLISSEPESRSKVQRAFFCEFLALRRRIKFRYPRCTTIYLVTNLKDVSV